MLAPILFFTYNRLDHTERAIEALKKNTLSVDSDIFIFSDAPHNEINETKVGQVRAYLRKISGFKSVQIIENVENKGCDISEKEGITEIINQYGKVIVIEDDIIVSSSFLEYLNNALDLFEYDERIWNIAGYKPNIKIPKDYPYEIYLSYKGSAWGWGTWKNRWNMIDWEKKGMHELVSDKKLRKSFCRGGDNLYSFLMKFPDAWDLTSHYSQWKNDKYTVYPIFSLVENIGTDGSGVHFNHKTKKFDIKKYEGKINLTKDIQLDNTILRSLKKINSKNPFRKLIVKILKKMSLYDILVKLFLH